MGWPIAALQKLDCDWSPKKFIEVNFSQLTDSNQILMNDFVCIHCHLCKISSQIIEWKFFANFDLLEINFITTYFMVPFSMAVGNEELMRYCLPTLEYVNSKN